jgi:glycosyltransferase involved in cell wall biosynthesis
MQTLDIIIPAFNAELRLERTLEAVFAQTVPAGIELGVIVVNNGSTDGTPGLIEKWADKKVRRVDYDAGQGRAPTINAGAAASTADYLLILDADCQLHGTDCLELIAAEMVQNVGAAFGYVTGTAENFWAKYQRRLETGRLAAGWQGWTTPCCAIRKELFSAVGGFPTDYTYYGFEDRDFICRLRSYNGAGELKSLPELRAIHDDDTNAAQVFEKMYESGRYSSGIFKHNHADAYRATPYAVVDVDTATTIMKLMLRSLLPFRPLLVRSTSWLTRRSGTPMFLGRPAVKLCSALSYFRGTVDRNRDH